MPKRKRHLDNGGKPDRGFLDYVKSGVKAIANEIIGDKAARRRMISDLQDFGILSRGGENGQVHAVVAPGITDADRLASNVVKITKANAKKVTPAQWTAAQDAATARGDMAEAQRLRDLHFKVSAPNTKVKEAVFNGSLSDKPFYEFNTNFRNAYWGGRDDYTTGAWFGTGDKNTLLSFAGDNPNKLKKFYLNFSNPFIKDAGYRRWDKLLPFNMTEEDIAIEAAKLREKGFPEYVIEDWKNGLKTTTDNYALKLETTDYDSGIIKNVYENKAYPDSEYGVITDYIASKPNQIKSADAVTYDNNGVRIPLGERDNFNINDIRYAVAPILAGGVGYGAYRNQKASGGTIHIAPSKRGTFTAAASKHGMGVQEFANTVLRNKDRYSPSLIKKANFARNASKWNH